MVSLAVDVLEEVQRAATAAVHHLHVGLLDGEGIGAGKPSDQGRDALSRGFGELRGLEHFLGLLQVGKESVLLGVVQEAGKQ